MTGRGVVRRAAAFGAAWAALAGWLLLLNSPHLGANAALHWDAEASITWGPAVGSRAELAEARAHLYDVLPHVPGTDPARVTDYYWSEPGLAFHESLTRCRYYYSWASDLIGHAAFAAGRACFGTPTAAVVCYQLTATAIVAAGLAGLLAYAVGVAGPGRVRRAIIGLTFAAVASSPVMLSVSRQVLQETPGFLFAAGTLLAVVWGGRSVAGMAVAGTLAFLTVRSRYTLGPAVGLLLPLAWGLGREDAAVPGSSGYPRTGSGKYVRFGTAFAVPFVALALLDLRRFGPFGMPWVYDAVMVRSAELFFHADPPYAAFWVAAFINLPLLVIPALGVWCWVDGGRGRPAWRAYAAGVLAVLGVMLWRTAAERVQFQGRHLFAVVDGATLLWLLVLPRVRWRPAAGGLYAAVTAGFLVWNVCSTFGPQRRASLVKVPDAVTVVTRHLSGGGGDGRSVFRDLWSAQFDWADSRLLHDTLTVWPYVHRQPHALVVIDAAAATANQFMLYAGQFPVDWCMMHGRADAAGVAAARAAVAAGRPVFLLTAPGRRPPAGLVDVGPPLPLDLMHVALRRVTAVAPAGVDLDAGAADAATADGVTVRRVRGTPGRFAARLGYLPRAQQEWLSYDGDPERVAYDVTGLRPGRAYAVGVVTWDPDRAGRRVAVSAGGAAVLSAATVAGPRRRGRRGPDGRDRPAAGGAAADGHLRLGLDGTGVAVCEVWVWAR